MIKIILIQLLACMACYVIGIIVGRKTAEKEFEDVR